MTTKEAAIDLIRRLPEDATLDDIIEELYLRRSIEDRLRELDENGGIDHEDAKARLAKWLE